LRCNEPAHSDRPDFVTEVKNQLSDRDNDITEILSTTRSVRRRIDFDRRIDPETLLDCIDVAVQAPTGVGDETWRFVVITDNGKKKALRDLYKRAFNEFLDVNVREMGEQGAAVGELSPNYRFLADHLHEFPALILVCRQGRPSADVFRQVAFYGSVLPAAWSLMIALRAQGLGSTWTTLLTRYESETAEVLSMPSDTTVAVLLPVGHMKGAVLRRADRRPARDVTYWNQWGDKNVDE